MLRAVADLPPRQRDAIVLRELEGRSYDEIASALGVGDGAVRQLLNRARHAVRAGVAAISPPSALRILELASTSSPAAKATAGRDRRRRVRLHDAGAAAGRSHRRQSRA